MRTWVPAEGIPAPRKIQKGGVEGWWWDLAGSLLWEALGSFGRLWEALRGSGKLWEAVGGSGMFWGQAFSKVSLRQTLALAKSRRFNPKPGLRSA